MSLGWMEDQLLVYSKWHILYTTNMCVRTCVCCVRMADKEANVCFLRSAHLLRSDIVCSF